jgi:hypothetical protein
MDKKQLLMIAAVCGGLLFLGALLPWWSASVGPISMSVSGTDFTLGVFILILGLAGGAAALAMALGKTDIVKLTEKQYAMIAAGAIGLAALFALIKFFDLKDPSGVGGKSIGIWLCLLAGIGGTVCMVMVLRQMGVIPESGSGDGGDSGSGDGGDSGSGDGD